MFQKDGQGKFLYGHKGEIYYTMENTENMIEGELEAEDWNDQPTYRNTNDVNLIGGKFPIKRMTQKF